MKALLVIDTLNKFLYGNKDQLLVPKFSVKKIISKCKSTIEIARKKNTKIIYVRCYHNKTDPCIRMGGAHCLKGTDGAEIVDQLKPRKSDIIVRKVSYDSFYNTKLEKILKNMRIRNLGNKTSIAFIREAVCNVQKLKDVKW